MYNTLNDDNKIDVAAAGHQIFEHGIRIGNCTRGFFLLCLMGNAFIWHNRCAVGAIREYYVDGETNDNNNVS